MITVIALVMSVMALAISLAVEVRRRRWAKRMDEIRAEHSPHDLGQHLASKSLHS